MSKFYGRTRIPRLRERGRAAIVCTMRVLPERRTTLLPLCLMAMLASSAGVASATARSVTLSQSPLIMRLDKDEFRIAFGINGDGWGAAGCRGMIRYSVDWKTADGMTHRETKHVSYTVSPLARRTIAVDRQYFHTAEGQHTTDVLKVTVDAITCHAGVDGRTAMLEP